jgi:hypothetical protein
MSRRRELKTRSRKGRKFSCEPWATNLVRWLNNEQDRDRGKNTKASRQRILDLHDLYATILRVIASAPANTDWFDDPPEELSSLLEEATARLQAHLTLPSVDVDSDGHLYIDYYIAGRAISAGEHIAAHALGELAIMVPPMIDRLKLCICHRYFFARFVNQRSCSASCRHKLYETSGEFKRKRREYMRSYYRLKTSGKVK